MLWTFEDEHGVVVGYNFLFLYALEHAGQPIEVMRYNSGILPAWRRYNLISGSALGLGLLQRLLRPRCPLYVHAWIAHPSGYAMLDKFLDVMWPSSRTDPPSPEIEDLARSLNDRFGARCPDPANPWLVATTTAVDDEPDAARFWWSASRPSVRYYREWNPDFDRGRALTVLIPLTLGALARLAVRVGLARLEKAVRPYRLGAPRGAGEPCRRA